MSDPIPLVVKDNADVPFVLTEREPESNVTIQLSDSLFGKVSLKGPKGDAGDSQDEFTYQQTSAALTWTVNHNLNKKPASVSILSPGGVEVTASITHISDNQLTVSFEIPYTGTVRIS